MPEYTPAEWTAAALTFRQRRLLDWMVGNGCVIDRAGAQALAARWNYTSDNLSPIVRMLNTMVNLRVLERCPQCGAWPVRVTQLGKRVANVR